MHIPNGFDEFAPNAVAGEYGAPDGRAPLLIHPHDYPAAARALARHLARHLRLFDRGGPVELRRDAATGTLAAVPLTEAAIVARAHDVCRPMIEIRLRNKQTCRPVTLPSRVARIYLDGGEWGLPPLRGMSGAPLLGEGGTIRAVDGYDGASGIFIEGCPKLCVPEKPTRDEAESALLTLRQFFRTFPFADAYLDGDGHICLLMPPAHDESAALTGLLTAVARPSLALAPGLIVRAPSLSGAGTGKGLLARTIAAIATGVAPEATPAGHSPEELDKRLVSAALAAAPVVMVDNVNSQALRSDTLSVLLSERPVRLRPLGTSEARVLDAATFVVVTGNGLTIAEDLVRRFIVCELDARTENPERRVFAFNPAQEAMRRRGELLSAALTIWRWGRQTHALDQGLTLGSFEQWGRWCRDPLISLGCQDVVARTVETKAADPQRNAAAELFDIWWQHHADAPVRAVELAEPVRCAIDPRSRGRQYIARRLSTLGGARVGGFVLTVERDGPPSKPTHLYRLRRET